MSRQESEYPDPRVPFEQYVLESIVDTETGIEDYSRDLGYESEEEFVSDLRGKRVCDLGSGHDQLVLEIALRGLDISVTSVNPYRNDLTFKSRRRDAIRVVSPRVFSGHTATQIDEALRLVDENASAAFAHDLSEFGDGEFDTIFDNAAVMHYSLPVYRDRYRTSIAEMLRVTKKGGKILVGDVCNVNEAQDPWYKGLLDETGVDYQYLRRRSAMGHRGKPGQLIRIGIEITK